MSNLITTIERLSEFVKRLPDGVSVPDSASLVHGEFIATWWFDLNDEQFKAHYYSINGKGYWPLSNEWLAHGEFLKQIKEIPQ